MQEFKPECIINLYLESRGKPGKLAWGGSLYHQDGKLLAQLGGFLGLQDRREAELKITDIVLELARQLKMEKIELSANFPAEGIFQEKIRGGSSGKELQLLERKLRGLWEEFRLRRIGKINAKEIESLRKECAALFDRKHSRR